MDKKNILTYQGLKKLEDELQELKSSKKKRSCCQDQRGKRTGRPFRRNAEYDADKRRAERISKPASKTLKNLKKMQK